MPLSTPTEPRDRFAGLRDALPVQTLSLSLLLWFALAGGGSWVAGILAALAAAAAGYWLAPLQHTHISLRGLVEFTGYFVVRSLLGGVDVARRAFDPRLPLELHEHRYPVTLPPGSARTLFVATVSLVPGTLSCDLDDGELLVHSIGGDPTAELDTLAARIRALFALPPLQPAPQSGPGTEGQV